MSRRKNVIILIMCIFILLIALGYAAFSTLLNINGTASTDSLWNVHFTNLTNGTAVGTATNKVTPSYTDTTAKMNVNLKVPGDSMTYELTVTNDGNLNAIIDEINAVAEGSSAIIYTISGLKTGDKLIAGESKVITIKIEYDTSVTSQPALTSKTLTVSINCVQDTGQDITVTEPAIDQPLLLSSKILRDNKAYADNVASPYVTSSTGINFGAISSDTNGKGLYYTNNNTEDGKTTYYFRGNVENNYVKLGSTYWRIIRINEDGSVRLIYQGTSATATGTSAQIGTSAFNSNMGDNAFVGYMYGTPTTYIDGVGTWSSSTSYWTRISTSSTVKMATSYTLDSSTGVYTLTNPIDGKYTSEYYNYYTCTSTSRVTCRLMIKLTSAAENKGYNELKGGEFHSGYYSSSYEQAQKNEESSTIKTYLDNWYKNNLLSYSALIADSAFCNDRSLYSGTGLGREQSYYGATGRNYYKKTPQFSCPNAGRDLFTTSTSSKGNKALTYPVGLITADEVAYAGGVYGSSNTNSSYYLYTGTHYWTMSPFAFNASVSVASEWFVFSAGFLISDYVYVGLGVRPVINLVSNAEITSGDGTSNNPYVIKIN